MESNCGNCKKLNNDKDHYCLRNADWCAICNFWQEKVDDYDNLIVVGGRIYADGGDQPNAARKDWLGFGGRVFRYRKIGQAEYVRSNNMWGGGEIPEGWRDKLPDNAEFENVAVKTFPKGSLYEVAWDIA